MSDTKGGDEVYSPPKRRDPSVFEHLEMDERSAALIQKVVRRKFRRSEHSIIKLEERLKNMGARSNNFDEEEKKMEQNSLKENSCSDTNEQGVSNVLNVKEDDTEAMANNKKEKENHFNLTMQGMHAMTVHKRLSLIENVQKNYGKYIRSSMESNPKPIVSRIPQNTEKSLDRIVKCNSFSVETSEWKREPNTSKFSNEKITQRFIRSNSFPGVTKNFKEQHKLTISSNVKQTKEHLTKSGELKKTREATERSRKIREIHEEVTIKQRLRFQSVSLPKIDSHPPHKNKEFFEEMRIIIEALKAINLRLNDQLKMLDGNTTNSRSSKQQLRPLHAPSKGCPLS